VIKGQTGGLAIRHAPGIAVVDSVAAKPSAV
jgi:hypothetical protein